MTVPNLLGTGPTRAILLHAITSSQQITWAQACDIYRMHSRYAQGEIDARARQKKMGSFLFGSLPGYAKSPRRTGFHHHMSVWKILRKYFDRTARGKYVMKPLTIKTCKAAGIVMWSPGGGSYTNTTFDFTIS